ncbi:Stage II sporulation protein E (SpoIIE) [compost metagenome]
MFDSIDATTSTVSYEGAGHIVLYTDGLMELLADEQDEQIEALSSLAKHDHHRDKIAMAQLISQAHQRDIREDDQCLVWISFDEGAHSDED